MIVKEIFSRQISSSSKHVVRKHFLHIKEMEAGFDKDILELNGYDTFMKANLELLQKLNPKVDLLIKTIRGKFSNFTL
jgi:hypothetical protein